MYIAMLNLFKKWTNKTGFVEIFITSILLKYVYIHILLLLQTRLS